MAYVRNKEDLLAPTDAISVFLGQEYLCEFFNIIRHLPMKTEEQVLKVKAALWAVVS